MLNRPQIRLALREWQATKFRDRVHCRQFGSRVPGTQEKTQRGGTFRSELFHGPKTINHGTRFVVLPQLQQQTLAEDPEPVANRRMNQRKMPPEAAHAFLNPSFKPPSKLMGHYNWTVPGAESCILRSAFPESFRNSNLETEVQRLTRGFAIQLSLEGKSNAAFFKPAWPHLFCRVHFHTVDLTNACIRVTKTVRVYLNRPGTLVTVFGYNKSHVRKLASCIRNVGQMDPYTMNGVTYSEFRPKARRAKRR